MSSVSRKLIVAGCLIGATIATREAVGEAWEEATGAAPPKNPADHGVTWSHALLWSVAASVTVGVVRTVVRRLLAEANEGEPLEESRFTP